MSKLYIPKKIAVGYQNRENTYTGKLAYIIYYDNKGVLRKETSWNSWRDKKIDPQDIDNTPTSGFVLNKKVGGYKSDWNFRNAYCRVYDPRGFEFEITVENLLFILECCSSFKGKGLEGEFVYAYSGKDLVLLPVNSESYQESNKHTELQNTKFSARSLKVGNIYVTKSADYVTYIGRFNYMDLNTRYYYESNNKLEYKVSKQHVFKNANNFVYYKNIQTGISGDSGTVDQNTAYLIDEYLETINGTEITSVELVEDKHFESEYTWYNFYTNVSGNQFDRISVRSYNGDFFITSRETLLIDGNNYRVINNHISRSSYYSWNRQDEKTSKDEINSMKKYKLFLVGKNGKKYEQNC